jgi:hypothetical protein
LVAVVRWPPRALLGIQPCADGHVSVRCLSQAGWSREQKDACLAQTADSFKYGGALLQHISRPNAAAEPA